MKFDTMRAIFMAALVAACFTLNAAEAQTECALDACADVDAAIEFWEGRTSQLAQEKLAYFTSIREALTSGDVPDALMERVTTSWEGANPGGRMYATWEAVFDALTALRAIAEVEEVLEEEPPTLAVEDEVEVVVINDPPPDLVPMQSDQNNVPVQPTWYSPPKSAGTPAPAWFNPGGGYTQGVDDDGHAGLWTHQFPPGNPIFKATRKRPSNVTADKYRPSGQIHGGDGIPDWSYESYEDAQINEAYPGRNFAKLGWGPWGDLPLATRQGIAGVALPTEGDIESALDICAGCEFKQGQHASSQTPSGTATYEGEAVGVFRPDLFGTVYGTRDDPGTAENEYDDGGPRVSLTADFDKGLIDGELTARETFPNDAKTKRISTPWKKLSPVQKAKVLGMSDAEIAHWQKSASLSDAIAHSDKSARGPLVEIEAITRDTDPTDMSPMQRVWRNFLRTHAQPDTNNLGKVLDLKLGFYEIADEMLRTPVVRWNGVRFETGTKRVPVGFEGYGLYGRFHGACSDGHNNATDGCTPGSITDLSAAITGYINHPRFVGSYGAAKCASDGTCPGFEMPDLVPGTVEDSMDSWGPWDDLPLATRQGIAGAATVTDMTGRKKHTGDNRTFWLPNGIGLTHGGPIRETWWVPTSLPSSGSATWRTHGDSFDAVINPAHSGLSDPILTLTADLTAGTIGAGITFMESGSRTGALESWFGLTVTDGGFSGDGLTGQVHNWRLKYLQGSTVIQSHNTGAAAIFGTVNADRVVGTYHAQRD